MRSAIQKNVLSRMKICLLVFTVAVGMSVMTGSAYCKDTPLPPEVQALIGMKIPPVIKGEASGNIPGFFVLGGVPALSASGSSEISDGRNLELRTGVLASGRPMLFLMGYDKNLTREILDALMLPPDLNDWYFEGNFEYALQLDQAHPDRYFKWRKNRFTLSETCWSHKDDERIIIGLIKQEKGKETCSHYSKRVKQAWLIDKQSGRLTPISTRGLQCHYISESDCY